MTKKESDFQKIKRNICTIATGKFNYKTMDKTCQFRGTEKHCNITTQTSCKKCKFYSPSTFATYMSVQNLAEQTRKAYETNKSACVEISKLLNDMEDIDEQARTTFKKIETEFERSHILEVALWQDSVNQYE